MKLSTLFSDWWVNLIQGILMIGLSTIIFNNPNTVLATMAFWFGATLVMTGLVGLVAYFANPSEMRNTLSMLGSLLILLFGLLMISKTVITIKAITILFGFLIAFIGWILLVGSWSGRNQWSLWWLIALLGICAISAGIKSIMDMYAGAENISNLIGISVLLSGTGLICLAFLKKKISSQSLK